MLCILSPSQSVVNLRGAMGCGAEDIFGSRLLLLRIRTGFQPLERPHHDQCGFRNVVDAHDQHTQLEADLEHVDLLAGISSMDWCAGQRPDLRAPLTNSELDRPLLLSSVHNLSLVSAATQPKHLEPVAAL